MASSVNPWAYGLASSGNAYIAERERSRDWSYRKAVLDLQRRQLAEQVMSRQRAFELQRNQQALDQLSTLVGLQQLDPSQRTAIAGTGSFQTAMPQGSGQALGAENYAQQRRRVAQLVELGTDPADVQPDDIALFSALSRMKADPESSKVFDMFVTGMPNLAGSFQDRKSPIDRLEERAFAAGPGSTAWANMERYYRARGNPWQNLLAEMMGGGGGIAPSALPPGIAPGAQGGNVGGAGNLETTLNQFVQRLDQDWRSAQELVPEIQRLVEGHPNANQILQGVFEGLEERRRDQNPTVIPEPSAETSALPPGGGEGIPGPSPIPRGVAPQYNFPTVPSQQTGIFPLDLGRMFAGSGYYLGQALGRGGRWAQQNIPLTPEELEALRATPPPHMR